MMELEVLTVGRVSVDLYADESGAGFAGPQRFVKSVGGTATNVAVAAARLGHRAAVLTRVGDDPFGGYVRAKLAELGVDARFVGTDHALRTPLAFAALTPPEDPELLFYREPAAPDMQLVPGDVDGETVRDVGVLWVAGSSMAEEPARSTVLGLLAARRRARHTVLDLDYRAVLWADPDDARRVIGGAIDAATVAIGNRAECAIAVGTPDPHEAARRILARGVSTAVVKLGADGVLVATADGTAVIPPRPVEVVCGLGAGDAFGGAFVHGLLAGWPAEQTVRYANVAGALVASRLMCADAMPTADEIELVMAR
jgi:5-dehydro-2-deoxygluconokinase